VETRASYLLVGVFVIAGITAMLAAAVWLAGSRTERGTVLYDIYFEGSVTGLKPGNAVEYRGIPVGGVVDMRIDPENVERVLVTIEVAAGTPIREDTEATLALQGITGLSFIQLTGGTQGSPELKPLPGRDRAVIRSRPSQLAALIDAAPKLLERAINVVARLEELLSEENLAHVSNTLANVEAVTGGMVQSGGEIETMLTEGAATMEELRTVTERAGIMMASIQGDVGGLAKETRLVLGEVRKAVARMAVASDEIATFLTENRGPLSDFSGTGLYEFSQLMSEARVLVAALSRLTEQIERDPARFLFGDQQQGVEVK